MKRSLSILALIGVMPLSLLAQDDDMYFVPKPKKETKIELSRKSTDSRHTVYHSGSNRDVDEYNRRERLKSNYQKIGSDSLPNDIIEFHVGDGTYTTSEENDTVDVYPGSAQYYDNSEDQDYTYSRYLGRFDGFYGWYDPFFYSYWGGPYWHSYYDWYIPGYYGWHNPWFYGGWYGWWHPHYYGWAGWYPSYYRSYSGPTGTMNHSRGMLVSNGRQYGFGGQRGTGNRYTGGIGNNNNGFGNRSDRYDNSQKNTDSNSRSYNFGGKRQQDNRNNISRPTRQPQSRPSFGGGSFGGGRSNGSFGGSRGGFGGRR